MSRDEHRPSGCASADGVGSMVAGDDPRVIAALEKYFAALETGQPPKREEFLAEHADIAESLAVCLDGLEFVHAAGAQVEQASEAVAADGRNLPDKGLALGDFRIVREVGKGGMGVVYEAEQLSLRRRVALKVLPFAATMDPRHLQRFHNEAQAAACLHHTNIVPVFSVGCERGVHFYAMQFIDGQPLSDIIRQLCRMEKKAPAAEGEHTVAYQSPPGEAASTPPPTGALTPLTGEGRRSRDYFRKVAELGVQAAEALDHAHQLGIVHRDIKPANLLLDGRGNLWVADFGLAHTQHGEASLTGTGQMVGTPRYMSPEQALAKRVPIDHRTDVYSLGVTLYELLTLRPAFASEDRDELLRQIAAEEPAKPRRLERNIPGDLEIIVLKAMEKRLQDRYVTAQELADDLRRWLLDQPIRARRPSWMLRMRKWARRHKGAVRAASVLVLALLMFGIGFASWWLQKRAAAAAEAGEILIEADRLQQAERWSEAFSAVQRARGALRAFGSDAGLRRQVDELCKDLEMAQQLEEARLLMTGTKDGQLDVYPIIAAHAAAFLWYGLDVEQGDPGEVAGFIRSRSIQMQLIAALDYWAILHWSKGDQVWKHLLAVSRAADPDVWRNRLRDAWERRDGKAMDELMVSGDTDKLLRTTLSLLGFSHDKHMNVSFKRAEIVLRRAQQRHPDDFWINHDLARLLQRAQPPRLEEAIGYYRAALALRPQSPGTHNNLGLALAGRGRLDEAIAEYYETIRLNKDIAFAHINLGNTLRKKGRLDSAIDEYREAIRLKKDIAVFHYELGHALNEKGCLDESIEEFREAIRLKKEFAEAHCSLGSALADKTLLDEAIEEYRQAIFFKKDDAVAHYCLGNALREKGRLDAAIDEYHEAIHLDKDYAEAHCNLGQTLLLQEKFRQAVGELRRGHELGSRQLGWRYPSATWLHRAENLAVIEKRWPALLKGQEQPKDARERLALALLCQLHNKCATATRWFREVFAEEPELAEDLDYHHRYSAACAAALAGCGKGNDADKLGVQERARLRRQALDWLRDDLKAYQRLLDKSPAQAGPKVAHWMLHRLRDDDFASVRDDQALAKLPAEERSAWRKLWADVAELLAKAQGKTPCGEQTEHENATAQS